MPAYDQQSLDQIIQQLQQQMNASGGGGTAASVPSNALSGANPMMGIAAGGQFLGQLGDLINSGGGQNVSTTPVATGVNSGLDIAGAIPGPQQPFVDIAAMLAPFIESFIPQGVPRDAKTQAIGSALSGSPNQLQALLGSLINKGVNTNNQVLSESGSRTLGGAVERTASMLEALTGQQIPGVTGTGNFQHDPTLDFTKLYKAAGNHQLPAGYQFVSDPSGINTAFTDISKMVGTQAPTSSAGSSNEWQKLMQQLISQHVLQRYQGPLGAPGQGSTVSTGGIPNVGLPHPLTNQNQQGSGPYPV